MQEIKIQDVPFEKVQKKKVEDIVRLTIKAIIIIGWISLAGITAFIVIYDYGLDKTPEHDLIEIHWHIAIALFVIVSACSFFLQTILIETENKHDLRSKIFHTLNHEHRSYHKNINQTKSEQEKDEIEIIIKHFGKENSHFLYQLYRQIQNILLNSKLRKVLEIEESEINLIKEELTQFYIRDQILDYIIDKKLEHDGLKFKSYILPLSFFLFTYFASFLILLPMVNSLFDENANKHFIPLFFLASNEFPTPGIPLLVIQWGFLGGLVYTSISLLYRFLRKDLPPRVYFNASFRLLLSGVGAIIVFFLFMIGGQQNINNQLISLIFLLCFSIGIAPIQFLLRSSDFILSRFQFWKHRDTAGKRSLINIEGIDPIIWERLSEEGLDCIQQLALCDPIDISFKTKFSSHIVMDWRDQAVLYLLAADVIVIKEDKENKINKQSLYECMVGIYGIKRFSQFYHVINNLSSANKKNENVQSEGDLTAFCIGLGYTKFDEFKFKFIIESIKEKGYSLTKLFFKYPEKNFNE